MANTITFPLTEFSSRFGYLYIHDGGEGIAGSIYSGNPGQFINRNSPVLLDGGDVLLLRDTNKDGTIETADMKISSKELKERLSELPENGAISGAQLAEQGYLALRQNPSNSTYIIYDQTPNLEVGWFERGEHWVLQSIRNSPNGPMAVLEVRNPLRP
ncbi:MAG: hypothetical protein HYU64_03800 [Armatimonadetes bacterium]|nr:hypothetical protein [Armatimonadota bacterium]